MQDVTIIELLNLDTIIFMSIRTWLSNSPSPQLLQRAEAISDLPISYGNVALMPDAHVGSGPAIVGSVVATKGGIVPSLVGTDIGCGMLAAKLPVSSSKLKDSARSIRLGIESAVPMKSHGLETNEALLWKGWEYYNELCKANSSILKKAIRQMGTLGGGNHFIEICYEEDKCDSESWVIVHTGSRGIGAFLANAHIETAKKFVLEGISEDLAYLVEGGREFVSYWGDLSWAQRYAKENRKIIFRQILRVIAEKTGIEITDLEPLLFIDSHHNYVSREQHNSELVYVTRKGAIRADRDQYGIIPGSMADRTYITKGKGNPESFCSCSHGAGRKMSRREARESFSMEDLEELMLGIEWSGSHKLLDEAPGAYKDINEVMAMQKDLLSIVAILKQFINVKG